MKGDKPIGAWGIEVERHCKNCGNPFIVLRKSLRRTCPSCRGKR
jgi:Zn finger protein HypA/HybF involved in hydrogenase expression